MADVYGNAVVNIAATNATDGSVGLFVERSTIRASRQNVRTSTNLTYMISDRHLGSRCLDRTPLSKRAWAFQERYLARRTIHFTAEQIFCECRYDTVCESFPTSLDFTGMNTFPTRDTKDSPGEWGEIVEFYSRALLTMPKDKLVALSGVARQFQTKNRDQYCAGLWRKTLELDLCWRIDRENTDQLPIQSRAAQYRAPTWSWACTDHLITYSFPFNQGDAFDGSKSVLCHVVGTSFELLTSDPLGQLVLGHLNVNCGPLLNGGRASSLFDDKFYFSEDEPEADTHTIDRTGKDYGICYYFDGESAPVTEDIYLLPIAQSIGLIVTTATRSCKGHFVRLGIFWIFKGPRKPLAQIPGATMDEALYADILGPDKNGIPQYSIILE
jgi:hypothetical protein